MCVLRENTHNYVRIKGQRLGGPPPVMPEFSLVGRGPPFAYWRKVGLQAYTKICSGVLCNIVVNIVMLLHIRVVIIER